MKHMTEGKKGGDCRKTDRIKSQPSLEKWQHKLTQKKKKERKSDKN